MRDAAALGGRQRTHDIRGVRALVVDFNKIHADRRKIRVPAVPEAERLVLVKRRHDYARRRRVKVFALTIIQRAVRVDAVPVAVERVPNSDLLDAVFLLHARYHRLEALGELLAVLLEARQARVAVLNPAVVDYHPLHRYVLLAELVELFEDTLARDLCVERVPRTPAEATEQLGQCALASQRHAYRSGLARVFEAVVDRLVRVSRYRYREERSGQSADSRGVARDIQFVRIYLAVEVVAAQRQHIVILFARLDKQRLRARLQFVKRPRERRIHPPRAVVVTAEQRVRLDVAECERHRALGRKAAVPAVLNRYLRVEREHRRIVRQTDGYHEALKSALGLVGENRRVVAYLLRKLGEPARPAADAADVGGKAGQQLRFYELIQNLGIFFHDSYLIYNIVIFYMTSLSYIRRGSFLFAQRYPHTEHIVVFSVDRAGADQQPRYTALDIKLRALEIRDVERAVGIV